MRISYLKKGNDVIHVVPSCSRQILKQGTLYQFTRKYAIYYGTDWNDLKGSEWVYWENISKNGIFLCIGPSPTNKEFIHILMDGRIFRADRNPYIVEYCKEITI